MVNPSTTIQSYYGSRGLLPSILSKVVLSEYQSKYEVPLVSLLIYTLPNPYILTIVSLVNCWGPSSLSPSFIPNHHLFLSLISQLMYSSSILPS